MKKLNIKKLNFNKKQWKYGSLSTAVIVIFIAVIVLLNIGVSLLDSKYSLRFDLTENKVFTVSDMTKNYLKELDKDVAITVLAEENDLSTATVYYKQIAETLRTYERLSDRITLDFVNPNTNPETVTKFRNLYTGDLSDKLIVIQCGDKIRALSQYDLIDYNQSYLSSKAEQALTSAISAISSKDAIKIAVMSGDSADDVSAFTSALSASGYELEEIDSLTGEIPEDAAALLVPCPKNDYTAGTIDRIRAFLDKGGKNLIYISSLYQNATPNLEALVEEYGMKIGGGYIHDIDDGNLVSLGGGMYAVVSYISNSYYTDGMQNPGLPIIIPFARPIEILQTASAEPLLTTADSSVVIPLDAEENIDVYSLPQSAQNVMAAGRKNDSNVLVISSSLMLNGGLTSYSGYNNGEYPVSAVNKLTGKENSLAIVAKDMTAKPLEMNLLQATLFKNAAMYFVPLAIMVIGIVVWYRRRNR